MDDHEMQRPIIAERDRIAALAQYGILDSAPEPGFDDIVVLASRICETPVALVSLVAADRQWFKARIGFPECETPLSQSVCAHAIREDSILVIPDLSLDDRTRGNSLVTGDPFIRFYAGAVLRTPHGVPIGSLCVIDTQPRASGLTPIQADSLQALARQVVSQLELRRLIAEREAALRRAVDEDALFRIRQSILRDERQHRLKNVVAIVQSIVLQTLWHSATVEDARNSVSSRLHALVKGQEALFLEDTEHTSLFPIVQSIIELYQNQDYVFEVKGPDIELGSKAALSISLILNELATNATKYGSFSGQQGGVTIDWDVEQGEDGSMVVLYWRESGGPPVIQPTRRGFGITLIERALSGSAVAMQFLPAGLVCRLAVSMKRLSED